MEIAKKLKELCDDNRILSPLYSQWDFDSRLIPKAIQNIALIFPHYSRHDESHSLQIISNIERILGDRVKQLSAIDLWLILEAAYWHDAGMIVASKDIHDALLSEEFKNFVEEISNDKAHELSEFCEKFKSLDPKDCFSFAKTPQEAVEKYRQVLALWFRAKHPNRSANAIESPWDSIGVSSPRTELLPKRLFTLLGSICRLHGAGFQNVINELPQKASGIGTEICHPRLVACLLRIGDLLDIDDNRFCPAMIKVAGEIPESSIAHVNKHASIRHLLVDEERVEITAICPDEESYEATDLWFKWIEEEFSNQTRHWVKITPNKQFGGLPTLSMLEANIAYPMELIDGKNRPRLLPDQHKMLELLQGSALYENKYQAIRELLQNAVDATLIKAWTDRSSSGSNEPSWDGPTDANFQNFISKYQVAINIYKKRDIDDEKSEWSIEIQDCGIGISKRDLSKLCKVGSSPDAEKARIVREMPPWLRPSGTFGIGLQSAFLISPDEVFIRTKSALSGENFSIKILSSLGKQRGLVYIRKNQSAVLSNSGTIISLSFIDNKMPKRWSVSMRENLSLRVFAGYDPIVTEEIPYEASKIADAAIEFARHSPIKISISYLGDKFIINELPFETDYFDEETNIGISNVRLNFGRGHSSVYFRGQSVSKFSPPFNFVSFHANLLGENSGDTLTINRNDIRGESRNRVYGEIIKAISNYFVKNINHENSAFISGFFLLNNNLEKIPKEFHDAWRKIQFPGTDKSIGDLLNSSSNFKFFYCSNTGHNFKSDDYYVLSDSAVHDNEFNILCSKWTEGGGWIQESIYPSIGDSITWEFSKTEINPYSKERLAKAACKAPSHFSFETRYIIPAFGKYKALSINLEKLQYCPPLSLRHSRDGWVIFPFFYDANKKKITTRNMQNLIKWVKENPKDTELSLEVISDLYKDLIKWIDEDVMSSIPTWRKYREIDQ